MDGSVYPILDKFLSLNCLIGLFIGLPGNILSLKYFYCTRPSLSTRLYLAICMVDLVTCVAHLPVLVVLLAGRKPCLFASLTFCIAWRVLFRSLQLLAIFLVMLLSASRAVAIVNPFHTPKTRAVLSVFFMYTLFLVVQNGALRYKQSHLYVNWDAYCFEDHGENPVYGKIDDYLYDIEIGVPSLVIFISFIVSVYNLRNSTIGATQSTKNNASITIVVVTAVFIVCNLPHLINLTIWNADSNFKNYSGPMYDNFFMKYYTWNISAIQMVVLNATLSPVTYFLRIAEFREWVWGGCERRGLRRIVTMRNWVEKSKLVSSRPATRANSMINKIVTQSNGSYGRTVDFKRFMHKTSV